MPSFIRSRFPLSAAVVREPVPFKSKAVTHMRDSLRGLTYIGMAGLTSLSVLSLATLVVMSSHGISLLSTVGSVTAALLVVVFLASLMALFAEGYVLAPWSAALDDARLARVRELAQSNPAVRKFLDEVQAQGRTLCKGEVAQLLAAYGQ